MSTKMSLIKTAVFLGIATWFIAPTSANATTIRFQQGAEITVDDVETGVIYTGTQDAELRQAEPDSNFDEGTGDSDPGEGEITVDGDDPDDSGFDTHGLIRFDDIFGFASTQNQSGVTIDSAILRIDIDNTGDDLSFHRMLTDWSESEVTWNNLGIGSDGVTIGSDATTALQTLDGEGNKLNIDVTEDLALWLAGTPNYGWAFLPTGNNGVDFDSSENDEEVEDRPVLIVSFSTTPADIPEPSTMIGMLMVGSMGLLASRKKS